MKNSILRNMVFTASFLLTLQSSPALAEQPVMIGREVGYDACMGISESSIQTNVHAAPDEESEIVDVLSSGIRLWDCDWHEQDGESWVGVIYPQREDIDCGPLSSSIPSPQEYDGPCASGWVQSSNIINIAG